MKHSPSYFRLLLFLALLMTCFAASSQADFTVQVNPPPAVETIRPAVAYNSQTGDLLVAYLEKTSEVLNTYALQVKLFQDGQFGGVLTVHENTIIGPPDVLYNPEENGFLLIAPYRIQDVAIEEGVSAIFLGYEEGGNLVQEYEYSLFSGLPYIGGFSPARVVRNTVLNEFLITSPKIGGIWAQRLDASGPIGPAQQLDIYSNLLNSRHHAIAFAPVADTAPEGGRYLFAGPTGGLGDGIQVKIFDSELNWIADVPFRCGFPEGTEGECWDADIAYGEVEGRKRFLVVYRDGDNCVPWLERNGECPEVDQQWTGVWGSYIDPERIEYPIDAINAPFPISKIPLHEVGLYKPRVAYSPNAEVFFVSWWENPTDDPLNSITVPHIRGNWVSYYVEHSEDPFDQPDSPVPPDNVVISDDNPGADFPDVVAMDGNTAAVVWQHESTTLDGTTYSILGDFFSSPCGNGVVEGSEACDDGNNNDGDGCSGDCATIEIDFDNDGYYSVDTGGDDCNDEDPSINPGAGELCDGVDNDCDASTADGFHEPFLHEPCDGLDADFCIEGGLVCEDGEVVCSDTSGDNAEFCNGLDDDCNIETADGSAESWIGASCDGPDSDLCVEGVYSCTNGAQVCGDTSGNSIEVCNNEDDDCDGSIDENLGQTTCGVGACEVTVDNCVAGVEQTCTPGTGVAEICDGIDNDCDESIDENLGQTTCGVGACEVTVANCVGGESQTCTPGTGSAEICDGIDNDCDESIDENLGQTTCGVGACEVTVASCIDGVSQTCEATFPDDGGVSVITSLSLTVSDDGTSLTGSASWTWSDGAEHCSGTSELSAVRAFLDTDIGGSLPSPGEFRGFWIVTEVADETDCNDGVNTYIRSAIISGEGSTLTIVSEGGSMTGTVVGNTLTYDGFSGASQEICDELDNDCDGAVDEGDSDEDGVTDCGVLSIREQDLTTEEVKPDNCTSTFNPTQADMDGDLIGDACDLEIDGDGRDNEVESLSVTGVTLDAEDTIFNCNQREDFKFAYTGEPDYLNPRVTHLAADNGTGNMVLAVSVGSLKDCSVVDESELSTIGQPGSIDFRWGFIEFSVTGVPANGAVDLTLVMPELVSKAAQYWQLVDGSYNPVATTVRAGELVVQLSLTDDDGDGVVQSLGAVGVPAGSTATGTGDVSSIYVNSTGAGSGPAGGPAQAAASSGGSGGCAIHPSGGDNGGMDLGGLLLLVIPLLLRWRLSRIRTK
jgi:hypothetical protein